MASRHLPVRPSPRQLKIQAKELLRAVRAGDPAAVAEFNEHHPEKIELRAAKLADAQLALARSYEIASWPRLVQSCEIIDAIWRDKAEVVRKMVNEHPNLLHEMARGGVSCNWGRPMSYAANLGRNRIIRMLHELGATDVQYAFERAALQGELDTVRLLVEMGARPARGSVMGPCETLNPEGLKALFDLGAELSDQHGDRLAPVALILATYSRNPTGKHACLDLVGDKGIPFPDTPTMAMHRGRIDLLEEHLRRDPKLFERTFSGQEIYPRELGCPADESFGLGGTPLAGTALLHMCVDYDEFELAEWMIANGANVNAKSTVDADGFGGYTPLFCCVVSQPACCGIGGDRFARLLLDHGADPNVRASLRKALQGVEDESMHEYRDVTPLAWGQRFHNQGFVDKRAMQLIAERGGRV